MQAFSRIKDITGRGPLEPDRQADERSDVVAELARRSGKGHTHDPVLDAKVTADDIAPVTASNFNNAHLEKALSARAGVPPDIRTAAISPAPDGRGFVVAALPSMDCDEALAAIAAHSEWLKDAAEARAQGREPDLGDPRRLDFGGDKLASLKIVRASPPDKPGRIADTELAMPKDTDLSYAHMQGARLAGARLDGTKMRHADLGGAHLNGACLADTDLSGADLKGADMSGADLKGANLRGADIRGADLDGSEGLDVKKLEGALIDGATRLPEGWEMTPEGIKIDHGRTKEGKGQQVLSQLRALARRVPAITFLSEMTDDARRAMDEMDALVGEKAHLLDKQARGMATEILLAARDRQAPDFI